MKKKGNNLVKIIGIIVSVLILVFLKLDLNFKKMPIQNVKENDIDIKEKTNTISLDEKLKRLTNKSEIRYIKNKKGENLVPIKINWLIYPQKDKDVELLLNKINHIFNKIYDVDVNNGSFNDINSNDPILEGLFVDFNIKLESINTDTVVFRIEEEGQLGATGIYGNFYSTFNKNNCEQVELERKEKYIEKVVKAVNESGNFLEKSRDEIVEEMFRDGNWYILDNKIIFIIIQDGANPPLYIEVEK